MILNRQEQPDHQEVFYIDQVENQANDVTVWAVALDEYATLLLPAEY